MGHGGARPGAGRKPSGQPIKKQRKIAATDGEWNDIKKAASKEGKSISQYLLDLHLKFKS